MRWVKSSLRNARYRAKKNNQLFNLLEEDFLDLLSAHHYTCAYCDQDLVFDNDPTSDGRRKASIDRIICELGYITPNVVICCMRCNAIKQDASVDELQKLTDALEKLIQERPLLCEMYG